MKTTAAKPISPLMPKMAKARPTEPGNYFYRANQNYKNAGGVRFVRVDKTRLGLFVGKVNVDLMSGQFSVKHVEFAK